MALVIEGDTYVDVYHNGRLDQPPLSAGRGWVWGYGQKRRMTVNCTHTWHEEVWRWDRARGGRRGFTFHVWAAGAAFRRPAGGTETAVKPRCD